MKKNLNPNLYLQTNIPIHIGKSNENLNYDK